MSPVARQRGLSLVELMIGLTIGMFLTVGLVVAFSAGSRSFQVQDDFARMQEAGVTALRLIGDSVRMAGFYGLGPHTTTITVAAGLTMAPAADCGSAANPPLAGWAFDVATPIRGFDALTPATVGATLPCIQAGNFLDTGAMPHPVLVLRHALGMPLENNAGDITGAADYRPAGVFVQSDSRGLLLFRGDQYAALRSAGLARRPTNSLGVQIDAPVFPLQTYIYYLRPCSRPATPPVCTATDDNGRPIPTLVRQQLQDNALVEQPLVEGVERWAVLYGEDTSAQPDGRPDRFTATPVRWDRVVAVRVSVLIRATSAGIGHDDSGKEYDLNGDGVPDFRCTNALGTDPLACRYRRHVFVQTFQLRNIALRGCTECS